MLELATSTEIAAAPARVWEVLTDFTAYPEWNPFITSIAGELRPGAQLRVRIEPPGGRVMTFRPTVLTAEPPRELRWLGRLLLPGIFDGEHIFRITPVGAGRTRLDHRERFRGLLVPMLRRSLEGPTRAGFEAMNRALTARVERPTAAP